MTTSKYNNQNLDKEELAIDKLFTSEKAFFISKEELEKEKARYSSYKVKSESKKQ